MLVRQATPEVERRIARRATLGIVRSAALSSRKLEQQVYGTAEPKQNGGVEARQVHGAAAPGQHGKHGNGAAAPEQKGKRAEGAAGPTQSEGGSARQVDGAAEPKQHSKQADEQGPSDEQGPPPTVVPPVERRRKRKRPGKAKRLLQKQECEFNEPAISLDATLTLRGEQDEILQRPKQDEILQRLKQESQAEALRSEVRACEVKVAKLHPMIRNMSELLATVTADLATQNEQLQLLQNSNAELISRSEAASEWRAQSTRQMSM